MALRNALLALLLAIVVLLLGAIGPAAAQRLHGVEMSGSGRCLELAPNGIEIVLRRCNGAANQDFAIENNRIRHRPSPSWLGCVGVLSEAGDTRRAELSSCYAWLTLATPTPSPSIPGSSSYSFDVNPWSNDPHCLDVFENEGNVYLFKQSTCHRGANQQFRSFQPAMLEFMGGLNLCLSATGPRVIMDTCNPNDERMLWVYDRSSRHLRNYRYYGQNACLYTRKFWFLTTFYSWEPVLEACDGANPEMRFNFPAEVLQGGADGVFVSEGNIALDAQGLFDITPTYGAGVFVQARQRTSALVGARLRRWVCRAVSGHLWDTNDYCASCTTGGADAARGCTTCRNQWDLSTSCTTCVGEYDPAGDCASCRDNWDIGTGCTQCENRWNQASNCLTCDTQYDPASECTTCRSNWNAASDCTVCDLGFDINANCLTCATGFNATTNCAFCEGVKSDCHTSGRALLQGSTTQPSSILTPEACQAACARKTGCTHFSWITNGGANVCSHGSGITSQLPLTPGASGVFGPQYCRTGPGLSELHSCQTCRNMNWDLSTGCASCSYAWNETSDCLACDNEDIDPSTNCTTCKLSTFDYAQGCQGSCINSNYVRDSGVGCQLCKNGFDESSSCTSCRNSWTGASCDVCALDEFSDCTEAECECGEELGSCSVGGVVTSIWNLTSVPQPWLTNETNITVSECADGVTPKDIYRHLSCAAGSLEGVRRAFDCTAKWLRGTNMSDLTRTDSYVYDGIVAKATAAALDTSLSLQLRKKAAQLAATWQVIAQQGTGEAFEYRYPRLGVPKLTTKFPAPPVTMPLNTTSKLLDEGSLHARLTVGIAHYLGLFKDSVATPLVETCSNWFRGFGKCECGSVYSKSAKGCVLVSSESLANLYSAHLFCGLAEGVIGTGASVEMIQRTSLCVQREMWKDNDLETVSDLLKTARAASRASAAAATDPDNAETLRQLQLDLSFSMADVATKVGQADALGVRVVASIKRADVTEDVDEVVRDDLRAKITEVLVAAEAAGVQQYVQTVANEISTTLNDNFVATTLTLEGLGDLIVSVTDAAIGVNKANFVTLAQTQQTDVIGQLGGVTGERDRKRQSFFASQSAIKDDFASIQFRLETLDLLGDQLAVNTEEFYECKKATELAALARARATAIFDIVVGCIEIVGEAAAMIATAGGSSLAKGATSAAIRRVASRVSEVSDAVLDDRVQGFLRAGILDDDSFGQAEEPSPEEQRQNQADALLGVLGDEDGLGGMLTSFVTSGGPLGIPSGSTTEILNTAANALEMAAAAGVPFAGGASNILRGAMVLADSSRQRDAINAEFEQNLAKSREALELLGQLVAKLGDFVGELMLEFGQLMVFNLPQRSVIESRSQSFWRSMQQDIMDFTKSTDMYVDMKKEVRRRALSEAPWGEHRQLLASLKQFDPEAETDAPETRTLLESRAGVRGTEVESTDMRRALGGKDPGCDLKDTARRGIDTFDQFFKELDTAIFFCESLHSNLMRFVTTTRELITLAARLRTLNSLKDTYTEAISTINASNGELTQYDDAFQRVLQRSYQRTQPSITSADPDLFERVATVQDGFLRSTCNAARYRYIQAPPQCDFYMATLINNGQSLNSLANWLGDMRDDLDDLKAGHNPTSRWVRLPVASTLAMRNVIAPDPAVAVVRSSVYSFSMDEPVAGMRDAACGYNHELEAYAFVLESRSTAAQLHPPALESKFEYRVNLAGPFIKLDAAGNRYAFLPEEQPNDLSGGLRVVQIVAADADCGTEGEFFDAVEIRDDEHKVCVQMRTADDFGASPVTPWGTQFSITLQDLAPLVDNENLDLELVMYARVSGLDMSTRSCPAAQFLGRPSPTDSASGLDAALIVGVSLGAVALAAAGAFAAKKYLATRSAKVATAKLVTTGGTANPMAQL